jgi:hypothetical protein
MQALSVLLPCRTSDHWEPRDDENKSEAGWWRLKTYQTRQVLLRWLLVHYSCDRFGLP